MHTRNEFDRRSPPSTPRWVKVLGVIVIVLILLLGILHLSGHGFGDHHGFIWLSSTVARIVEYKVPRV